MLASSRVSGRWRVTPQRCPHSASRSGCFARCPAPDATRQAGVSVGTLNKTRQQHSIHQLLLQLQLQLTHRQRSTYSPASGGARTWSTIIHVGLAGPSVSMVHIWWPYP